MFVDAWSWDCQAPDGTVSLISCYFLMDTYVLLDKTGQGQRREESHRMRFQYKKLKLE